MGHIVLLLFSFFTEAVILWQYASSLFTSSYSSKIRLALLSALYTILFLLSLLEQTGLNVVSFFVFNTVFLYMLFKLKLLLALFHSAILTAIMGISEIAVLGITSRFFPHFLLETDAELVFYNDSNGKHFSVLHFCGCKNCIFLLNPRKKDIPPEIRPGKNHSVFGLIKDLLLLRS